MSMGDTAAGSPIPIDFVHDTSRAASLGVARDTCGSLARGGNPQGTKGLVCRACLSLDRLGYCHVCVDQQTVFSSLPVSLVHGVATDGQGPVYLVGETSGFRENPLVGSRIQGFFPQGSFPQDSPIFTSGSCSPLFLSKEVHSFLADFRSEHVLKGDANILQEDFLVSRPVPPAISNTSPSGGFEAEGFLLEPDFIVSSTFEGRPMEVVGDRVSSSLSANVFRRNVVPAKKRPKSVRKNRVLSLALGEGVALEDMSTYAERDLVGPAQGRNLCQGFLKKWVSSNWGSQVSVFPEVSKLMKGWFVFLMASREDADRLVSSRWEMAGVPIVLRKWSPIFDAARAKAEKEPIWVKLSSLPIHLWNLSFFKMLGNHLGKYVDVDFSFKTTEEMAVARVLVLLDLREGLAPEICLIAYYGDVTQILDYEGVPFRYHICHYADHLVADCDQPSHGFRWTDGRKEGI